MSDAPLLPIHILSAELYDEPTKSNDIFYVMKATVQVGPFMFVGLGLAVAPRRPGGFVISLPTNDHNKRRVVCNDVAQRQAMIAAAVAAYTGLGGPDLHHTVFQPLVTAPSTDNLEPSTHVNS